MQLELQYQPVYWRGLILCLLVIVVFIALAVALVAKTWPKR